VLSPTYTRLSVASSNVVKEVPTRREEILAIAARVFAEKGIMNATVRDIGQEAGILSGSLYHHFESKDQMIEEVLRPVLTSLSERYRQIEAEVDDPAMLVRQVIFDSIAEAAARPNEARIFRNDAHHLREIPRLAFVDEQRKELRTLVISALRRGMDNGAFRSDLDPGFVFSAMFDMVLGSIRWFHPLGRAEPARVGEQLALLVLDGLKHD
jgi:TetR/AcrR family transcriptional regulator, cholesterol catabolism regulator